MGEKKVPYFVCTDDETDSTDEAFVFTRKRKADSFFIDLTEDRSQSKKSKAEVKGEKPNLLDSVDTIAAEDEAAQAEPEVQVLAVYDGDKLVSGSDVVAELPKVKSEAKSIQKASVLKVSVPKIMSPPRVVRVVGGPYMSGEVTDLTKVPPLQKGTEGDVNLVRESKVEDPEVIDLTKPRTLQDKTQGDVTSVAQFKNHGGTGDDPQEPSDDNVKVLSDDTDNTDNKDDD